MKTGNALFYSVSGQRLTNRTDLYDKLKTALPREFPGQEFEFIGNPFNLLPFPLTQSEENRTEPATTRLLECWTKLDKFCHKRLRPLLNSGSVIITHGFGIDALLYSTACADCDEQNDEAVRLHNSLVHARLHQQGVSAPEYFITRANIRSLDARMIAKMPELKEMAPAARMRFIRYEEQMIHDYFDGRIKNQKPHHFIEADDTVEEMVAQVVSVIGKRLKHRPAV